MGGQVEVEGIEVWSQIVCIIQRLDESGKGVSVEV